MYTGKLPLFVPFNTFNLTKMTMYEFGFLEIAEQEELLNKDGVFIQTFRNGDFLVDLYHFQTFYVELFYKLSNEGKVVSRCFLSSDEITSQSNDSFN